MSRPWMPFYDVTPGEQFGYPVGYWGYDGRPRPERVTPRGWRSFYMANARKLGTHTKEEWERVKASIARCVECGATDAPLAKDHIHPVSRGGCDCIYNLQPLCDSCNSSKGARG